MYRKVITNDQKSLPTDGTMSELRNNKKTMADRQVDQREDCIIKNCPTGNFTLFVKARYILGYHPLTLPGLPQSQKPRNDIPALITF